uniref:Uncharacterized protein n=1 Tax=Romanomermis culicivorax TaxID=13658 RepID=A0A915L403_ROMCU
MEIKKKFCYIQWDNAQQYEHSGYNYSKKQAKNFGLDSYSDEKISALWTMSRLTNDYSKIVITDS